MGMMPHHLHQYHYLQQDYQWAFLKTLTLST